MKKVNLLRVAIVAGDVFGKTAVSEEIIKHYGNNVVVVSPEEAMEKGITQNDFENPPIFPIHARPEFPDIVAPFYDTGRTGKGGRARNRSKYGKR